MTTVRGYGTMQWNEDGSRFWSDDLQRWVPVIRGGDDVLTEDQQKLANTLMGMFRKELIAPLTAKLAAVEAAQKDSSTKADSVLAKLESDLSESLKALGLDEDTDTDDDEDTDQDDTDGDKGGDTDTTPKDLEGRLAFMSRRYERRIAALERSNKEKDEAAKSSEIKRRESERDRLLQSALASIKANDPRRVMKMLSDNVRWDEDKGIHVFVTTEGAEFPMTEDKFEDFQVAVKEELPPWALQATAQTGGSGSGSPRIADRMQHAKQVVEDARKVAKADPRNDQALAGMLKAKREAKLVEAEAAAGRGGTRS